MRGAPAIAIVGCLSLAVELRAGAGGDDPVTFIRESLCHLTSARPTAVNMGRAARELMEFAENESMEKNSEQLRERWGWSHDAVMSHLLFGLIPSQSFLLLKGIF